MGLKLVSNWLKIIRYAWSVRLIVLAGLLSGLEIALPVIDQIIFIPRGLFAGLSFFATCAAFYARIVAQSKLRKGDGE